MKFINALLMALLLAGCASTSPALNRDTVLHDDLFVPLAQPIDAGAVFRPSDEMQRFLHNDIAQQLRRKGQTRGLFDALYDKTQLRLEYDSAHTRTASEAFAARSGNCLSLVIMTAAFAKELGMFVYYQGVDVEENWLRKGDVYFSSGHVNITLGRKPPNMRSSDDRADLLTIDFTPLSANAVQRGWHLSEATIVAMYMNNRAAETLAAGRTSEAYWWAREALRHDGNFTPAYITLGVVYRRSGHPRHAETALREVLARDADNVTALANLTLVLNDLGRSAELASVTQQLKRLVPYEPYHFFKLGQTAMREKNFGIARDLFAREVNRQPYNPEFHYWLASAHIALNEKDKALRHITLAIDTSNTFQEQGIYAAKLERIRTSETR